MQGHMDGAPRRFKPMREGHRAGGSKKGKPQGNWPWVLKIIADAVVLRAKGSSDAWLADRKRPMSDVQFGAAMDALAPGWRECGAGEDKPKNLYNRVYKMYYFGTSGRGKGHDPSTRATWSNEHWHHRFSWEHPLARIHDDVWRGRIQQVEWCQFAQLAIQESLDAKLF